MFSEYLFISCSIIFVLFLIIQFPVGKKIAVYLENKDKNVCDRIIPHKIGTIYFYCLATIFLGCAVSAIMIGLPMLLLGVIILIPLLIFNIHRTYTTELTIDDGILCIKKSKNIQKVPISDIASVDFRKSILPYNRCLFIILRNGVRLTFEQENYFGLNWLYHRLQEEMSAKSDSPS